MYDRPEIRGATDRFWGLIRDNLRTLGVDAPQHLSRDMDPWDIWQSPDLLLAQTCGFPFRARLHPDVSLVASPDYALPGCPPGHYNSVILTHGEALPPTPRIAINDPLSQSGWAALHDWATQSGTTLGPVTETGSHAASAQAVADGKVDLCALDAQTWRLIQRHAPLPNLTELARTAPTPALPFITARTQNPEPILAAMTAALGTLPDADRSALDLHALIRIDAAAYLAIPTPPNP